MKKILALALALCMIFALVACGQSAAPAAEEAAPAAEAPAEEALMVAMITDYGDITDESFNQATYEACKEWCEANGANFTYFKPASDSDDDRIAMIEKAIDEGYTAIVMPGYAFGPAIVATAPEYPDITFIAIDVSEGDLGEGFEIPENLYCCVYQEELCGYQAGYATVAMGYSKLGVLGGMAVPAVVRYCYGFVQGANAAAEAMGKSDVEVTYGYTNQFFGDADITAAMDTWYNNGIEAVFACGGGIYTSVAEAANKVGAKFIGVDVDQTGAITKLGYDGLDMTLTSAMKGLGTATKTKLDEVKAGAFKGGMAETLGLVSATDPSLNYVGIPMETTQWCDDFTKDDYVAMVAAMFNGELTVSNDITAQPGDFATAITLTDIGSVK